MSRACALLLSLTLAGCIEPGDDVPWERQDEHAPVPAETCPPHEAVGVSTGVQPRIRFDFPGEPAQDLDQETLDDRSVTLISSGEFRMRGHVTLDERRGVVLFVPRSALQPFVRYQLRVTLAVRDLLGNPVRQELVSEFVTGDVNEQDLCAFWPDAAWMQRAP